MRRRLVVGIAVVVVIAAAAVGVWAWPGSGGDGVYIGSRPSVRLTLPDFALRDQDGRFVRSAELRGNVVVVTFLETKCKEACPVIAERIRAAASALDPSVRRRVIFLAVSVHPGDDTPASVRAFLRRHRAQRELRYVIGSEHELRPVWRRFMVLAAVDSGDADIHSAPVRVYDAGGVWVSTLNAGADLTAANLAHDVRLAAETAG